MVPGGLLTCCAVQLDEEINSSAAVPPEEHSESASTSAPQHDNELPSKLWTTTSTCRFQLRRHVVSAVCQHRFLILYAVLRSSSAVPSECLPKGAFSLRCEAADELMHACADAAVPTCQENLPVASVAGPSGLSEQAHLSEVRSDNNRLPHH